MFGREIGRDRGLPIAIPIARGGPIAVEGVKQREYSIQPVEGPQVLKRTSEVFFWAMMWGGVQDVWGEENVQRTRSVVDFCTGKPEQRHLRGMENVPYEGGPRPLFWEGCHS